MEIDISALEKIREQLGKDTILQLASIENRISKIEIPSDSECEMINLKGVKQGIIESRQNIRNLASNVDSVIQSFNDMENANIQIGDSITLSSGINYYANALGQGSSGTIGSERPEGDYIINRIAFYIDGKLVANIDDTGTDIEEAKIRYANEYAQEHGIDVSDVNVDVSLHVQTSDGKATGWIDREQIKYEDLKNQKDNLNNVEREDQLFNSMKAYDENVKSFENDESIENNVVEVERGTAVDVEVEKPSFRATLAESITNVTMGAMKGITKPIDFVLKTDLTDFWDELEAEAQEYFREEEGSAITDEYTKIQEITGAASMYAILAAGGMQVTGIGTEALGSTGATDLIYEPIVQNGGSSTLVNVYVRDSASALGRTFLRSYYI